MDNRVVHFEIPAEDPQKMITFFTTVFGWKIENFASDDYWSITTGAEGTPGINGGLMKRRDPQQPIANSIQVENIDVSLDAISRAGGTMVVPKMPIPGVGYLAYFKDPEGNIHGLFQEDPSSVWPVQG